MNEEYECILYKDQSMPLFKKITGILQLLDTSWPISSIVLLKIDWTKGMQPPQPVPALVHDLTSFMDLHVPFLTFEATSPLVTLWHEQI